MNRLSSILKYIYNHKLKFFVWSAALFTILILVIFVWGFFDWISRQEEVAVKLDSFQRELSETREQKKPVEIFDRNQRLIGTFYRNSFRPIRLENLENHSNIIWAVLSSEDREFYEHFGINISAILRAILRNLTSFRLVQGGSTITQQLAKLSLEFGHRNLFHKVVELYCALYIESKYDKRSILAMYLNQVYMGKGNTGIEDASRFYFRKSALALDPAEAALLTGVIQAPSVYNPMSNLATALKKQRIILNAMRENPGLRPGKSGKPLNNSTEAIVTDFHQNHNIREEEVFGRKVLVSDIGIYGYDKDFRINLAPDFNRSIRNFVMNRMQTPEFEQKDLRVFTTLDIDRQTEAEKQLRRIISEVRGKLQERWSVYKKKGITREMAREQEIMNSMNGSLVSLEPGSGDVLSLIGSFRVSSIYRMNRAEEAFRQPGSTIKGLVYALAFDRRMINPSSKVVDEKLDFNSYSPRNWYKGFKGEMTAREAVAVSSNTIPVKLLHEMGTAYFLDKLGEILNLDSSVVQSRFKPNLSLALGSGELTPMELNLIYSTIANGGRKIYPRRIIKITDTEGNLLYEEPKPEDNLKQIIDPIACAMAINAMQAVISPLGTVRFKSDFPMAGKTGTVQSPKEVSKRWGGREGVRDVWFAGVVPGMVTTLWVGSDSGAPFPGSGSSVTGLAWYRYVSGLNAEHPLKGRIVPALESGYSLAEICGDNGLRIPADQDAAAICKVPFHNQVFYAGEEPEFMKILPPETGDNTEPEVKITARTAKETEISEGVELEEPSNTAVKTGQPEN